jgi:hypothetical protein
MAWIVVVPPSPATRTSATRKASGSARPASSVPGGERSPCRVQVDVNDGVVRLTGRVRRRSQA